MRVQGECHDMIARHEKPGFLRLPFVFSTFNLSRFPPFTDGIRIQHRKLITKRLRCQIRDDLSAGCGRNVNRDAQRETCCGEKVSAIDGVWLGEIP